MTRRLIKIHKNGTKVWQETVPCDRCGGLGASEYWRETGCTCWKCHGTGTMTIRTLEYTPEHEAELIAKKAREQEKRTAEAKAHEAEYLKQMQEMAEELERRKQEEDQRKARSQYIGEIGQKITAEIAECHTAWIETEYGSMAINIMTDVDGNKIIWKTSTGEIGFWKDKDRTEFIGIDEGHLIMTATVKAHSEYKGEKQTQVIRCKFAQK